VGRCPNSVALTDRLWASWRRSDIEVLRLIPLLGHWSFGRGQPRWCLADREVRFLRLTFTSSVPPLTTSLAYRDVAGRIGALGLPAT
jgi:hypothetical protein